LTARLERLQLPAVAGLFLASGAAGLVYEVVWLRQLSFVFGVTSHAATTVLAAFMGGMALGSWLLGRRADRMRRPMAYYALLQAGVAATGLLVPVLLKLAQLVYVPLYDATGGSGFIFLAVRAVLAFLVLLPVTTLMGATLPALARHVSRTREAVGRRVGLLYALNTAGAVVGTLLTGFVLIEHLGLWGSTLLAAGINLAAAGGAFALSRPASAEVRPRAVEREGPTKRGRLLLWLYAVSGFAALGLELVWNRMLILWFSNVTYTFSAMLAVYLVGLALGGAFGSWLVKRIKRPERAFVWGEIGVGLSALATTGLALNWPRALGRASQAVVGGLTGWGSLVTSSLVLALAVMLLPTFLLGMLFPVVVRLYAREVGRVGRRVGELYAANSAGTILGSVATGFVLIPLLGFQGSLLLLTGLSVLVAAAAAWRWLERKAVAWGSCAATLAFGALWLPFDHLGENFLREGETLLSYAETESGTIEVREREGDPAAGGATTRRLVIDGNQATYTAVRDMRKNRMLAHLPMLVHPDPREVLVICFGSGSTFGALAVYDGLERVDCVEIAPGVVACAPYFREFNLDVLENPLANLIIDDGRNYLLCTDRRYDVITAEPMPPAVAGVVNLYTVEYYELCRGALEPGGVCAQWIPLYQLAVRDVRMLAASFARVFPHAQLWLTGDDIVLLGSPEPLRVDRSRFAEAARNPEIVRTLAEVGVPGPEALLDRLVLDSDAFRAYTRGFEPVTDDRPVVEYTAPRNFHAPATVHDNLRTIERFRP
jgi:spermidine synthase